MKHDLTIVVINPLHTNAFRKAASLRKTKTDKVDARVIASMLMSDAGLKPYSDTLYHNEDLKSFVRYRFDRVSENKLEVLVPNSMYHCMSGKSHVLAIKHTAYYYSSIEMELIGKTIGYILDHSEEIINKECIYASYIKEDIICFEESRMANQPKRKAKMDSTRIIELIITSPYFQLTQIEKENYSLSKNLMIRITKTGNGYLAIRHKNYDVQYPNSKYDFTERYRNILMEKGWNCDTPVWLGKKLIKDYGRKDDEIVTKIVSEINDIVELVHKDN